MRIIKSQKDLDLISRMQALPPNLIRFAQAEFHRLYMAFGEAHDVLFAEFHTDEFHCGHIVVLEHGDNIDDLSVVGMQCGLRNSMVECVELYQIEQLQMYRIIVLFNNEFAQTFLFEAGLNQDALFEAWLAEEAAESVVVPSGETIRDELGEMPF